LSAAKKEKISSARAAIRVLESEGVEVVFGYPGGAILPFYDELRTSSIRHIMVRHEQGAAHMADGYARSTGGVGVCVATSGPGATNLVTGIATAYMDSSSVIAITGQVSRNLIGNDAFQEVDITGITIPVTKHNYLVSDARDIPRVFREAFHLARTGRKGPVLVDIPKDVLLEQIAFQEPGTINMEGYRPNIQGHKRQILKAAEAIRCAKQPVIIAGGGVLSVEASDELLAIAEKAGIPVATTLMGKGAFPGEHPLSLGMTGYHGTRYANYAVQNADLILALGVRFGDRTTGPLNTFAQHARIIHVDIDPAEIGKNIRPSIPIQGDIKQILTQLLEGVSPGNYDEWRRRIDQWKAEHPLCYNGGNDKLRTPYIIEELQRMAGDWIVVTEVGRHQIWASHYFRKAAPRRFITSGGLGTMGFGLPAAIGAAVGNPGKTVVNIAGDGSFMMTCQQLMVASELELPVVTLIMDDRCLGMIRQLQEVFYDGRVYSAELPGCVDFVQLASAMGARAIKVERRDEVVPALKKAFSGRGPCVVDFSVTADELVLPMVKGNSLEEFI